MEVKHPASAGTMESSDIMVMVSVGTEGIFIELKSDVEKQFGAQIRRVIAETAENLGVRTANIRAVDKGALDCVIRARAAAALLRACDESDYPWEA